MISRQHYLREGHRKTPSQQGSLLLPGGGGCAPFNLHLRPPLCLPENKALSKPTTSPSLFLTLQASGISLFPKILQDDHLYHSVSAYSSSFMREQDLPDKILSEPRCLSLLIGYFQKSKGLQDGINPNGRMSDIMTSRGKDFCGMKYY